MSNLLGGAEAVAGRRVAGTDPRTLGERDAGCHGDEQNAEASLSDCHHALSLERKVEAGEEAVVALVGAAVRGFHRLERRELDVPGETGASVDEWIVAVAGGEDINIAKITGQIAERLPGHSRQFVTAEDELPGRIGVVRFEGPDIPSRALRTVRQSSVSGSVVGEKHVVV